VFFANRVVTSCFIIIMVVTEGGVDVVLQWLSSLLVLPDAIEDELEQSMEASPDNGVFVFAANLKIALRPRAAMMRGFALQGHLSSLTLTWEASGNETHPLRCHLEVDVANIRVDKDPTPELNEDSNITSNLELRVSFNRLHVVVLDSALLESSKVCQTLQQFMTLDFLGFPRATMHLVEVYNSKGELISVLKDLLHNRDPNLAATASTISRSTSKISTKIGNHMVNLFGVELVSSLQPTIILLERSDIPLKVTIQKAEIMSLLCLHRVSLSAIIVGNSLHVLQVEVGEGQLTGSKELLDVWKHISEAATLDNIEAPFAKISAMPCLVTMKGVVQAVSTLPFDKVPEFEGDEETTLGSILRQYSTMFSQRIQRRLDNTTERTSDMSDRIAATVGCAAMHASIATPIGLAASLVAVGVKDGITNAASVGKQARGETKHASYQFGDVTRGLVASFRSSKSVPSPDEEERQQVVEKPSKSAASRYGAIGGSSVGAVVGLTLIGGPVGLLAGSLMGGSTAKKVINSLDSGGQDASGDSIRQDNGDDFEQNIAIPGPTNEGEIVSECDIQATQNPASHQNVGKKTYQFGDFTRGVVARGKLASQRDEGSSYKFGDFTRGLFS
jgi:hypothetical protein